MGQAPTTPMRVGAVRITVVTAYGGSYCNSSVSIGVHYTASFFTGTEMGYYAHLLLLTTAIILLLCCLGNVHGVTEYYVKPTEFDNASCPGEPCHIYSQPFRQQYTLCMVWCSCEIPAWQPQFEPVTLHKQQQ